MQSTKRAQINDLSRYNHVGKMGKEEPLREGKLGSWWALEKYSLFNKICKLLWTSDNYVSHAFIFKRGICILQLSGL